MDVSTRKTEEVTTTIVLSAAELKELVQQALGLKKIGLMMECIHGDLIHELKDFRVTVTEKDCVVAHPVKRTEHVELKSWQLLNSGPDVMPFIG